MLICKFHLINCLGRFYSGNTIFIKENLFVFHKMLEEVRGNLGRVELGYILQVAGRALKGGVGERL